MTGFAIPEALATQLAVHPEEPATGNRRLVAVLIVEGPDVVIGQEDVTPLLTFLGALKADLTQTTVGVSFIDIETPGVLSGADLAALATATPTPAQA